jgi:hypothetical protein
MKAKKRDWILTWRHPQHGTVTLCQDGLWRKTPDYGTYPECVKQYTSPNWALRRVRHQMGEFTAKRLMEISG